MGTGVCAPTAGTAGTLTGSAGLASLPSPPFNAPVSDPASSLALLQRWHAGEAGALEALVAAQLPWLKELADRRLGTFLRQRGEATDYLHDALLEFLRDAPRFTVRDEAQLRSLLARVLENTLRDKHEWFRAKRRFLAAAVPLPTDSVLDLNTGAVQSNTPSREASREEARAWIRLALELLDPEDRQVLVMRDYEERSFVDIAKELGSTPDAIRMRWQRAVSRLASELGRLRANRAGDGARPPRSS